jgi:hypothetical protein
VSALNGHLDATKGAFGGPRADLLGAARPDRFQA